MKRLWLNRHHCDTEWERKTSQRKVKMLLCVGACVCAGGQESGGRGREMEVVKRIREKKKDKGLPCQSSGEDCVFQWRE